MKSCIAAAIFMSCLACYGQGKPETGKHVVLPNAKLLRCVSLGCSQLWQDKAPDENDIYPKEVTVDLPGGTPCPLGVMAYYDKSVSLDDLRAAIDLRYGKWAKASNDTSPVKLWRVESESFSIQLSNVNPRDAKISGDNLEVGTKTVVYMAFQPTKCGSQ
jgi:hypothetical protein